MIDYLFAIPFTYPSLDGTSTINAQLWTNMKFGENAEEGEVRPKGVIQFVHGMTEHIERYETLANYFVGRGFVVCANDHIGHGHTAKSREALGHMPAHGGKKILIEDIHTLRKMVAACFPDVPYIMYGHSMGSLILRAYLARYGKGLAAAVLSATHNGPLAVSLMGKALAQTMALVKGDTYHSQFFHNQAAGGYAEAIEDARTPLDWLTHDEAIVDEFMKDDLSNFPFTVGGYATLLDITAEAVTKKSARKVPKDLPLLIIGGSEDPVGENGEALWEAAKLYRDAGVKTVDLIIYEGMRHEPQNEIGRERVFDDVATWIENQLTA